MLFCALAISCLTLSARIQKPACELHIVPEWRNLDNDPNHIKELGGNWVLVARFVIKRRSKDFIRLDNLSFAWRGEHISHLAASLFRGHSSGDLIPVEENLVCDGIWRSTNQILQLRFQQKEYLQPTNIFYLVLTVPERLEKILKKGHFELLPDSLPRQLRPAVEEKNFRISMLAANTKFGIRRYRLTKRA